MDLELERAVSRLLAESTGRPAEIVDSTPLGGGSINRTESLGLRDGRRFVVKSNPAPPPQMFEREAEGVEALAAVGAIRVPNLALAGGGSGGVPPFLILEAIARGEKGGRFFEEFGRAFAELHRRGRGRAYGFDHDNYLGSTLQPNGWSEDWCSFFARHRLCHQLRLARASGQSDPELELLSERLLERLEDWLAEPEEPPCLLHGDLWGGNYLVDERGRPVLVDPAVYYGRREADLAMTQLFGGFEQRFYDAYEEAWPLEPGAAERLEIYKLYHLLNHLNLFGSGYRQSCLGTLRRLVG